MADVSGKDASFYLSVQKQWLIVQYPAFFATTVDGDKLTFACWMKGFNLITGH